ncbi:MAG: phosphoglucosamine mutase, partial [Planctomycetota bacterium]
AFTDAKVDTGDGCRFDLPDGWIHIRTSNTEPIMRMIVETKDPAVAKRYLDTLEAIRVDVL